MIRTTLSELTRLQRRGVILGWLGLSGLLSAVIVTFVFTAVGDGTEIPEAGPGASFPSAADLMRTDGFIAGLGGAATILGVVTLAFWAIAAATDFSTGLIRLLVQAEPRRSRLLLGKVAALTIWTAAATTVAMVLVLVVSLPLGMSSSIDTSAWGNDGVAGVIGDLGTAWLDTFLALLVWGTIGLMITIVTRSSAVAITAGVGYVLVVESIVGLVAGQVADWLPGAVLTSLASGGTGTVGYAAAVALGIVYATVGLGVSLTVFTRRDITD